MNYRTSPIASYGRVSHLNLRTAHGFLFRTPLQASPPSRAVALLSGAAVLAACGSVVKGPRWDFGKLLGIYVGLFFLMAQLVARLRFRQSPNPPIHVGGSLIVAGGLRIAYWNG